MSFRQCAGLLGLLLILPLSIWGQQTAVTSQQGATVLLQALTAMVGTTSINDVTLTGAARRIAGSDDETGTAVLKALATGQSRLDFTLPSGQSSEIRSIDSNGVPTGEWIGPDGVSHAISQHNLMISPAWFQPAIALELVFSQNQTVSYVAQETKDGVSVFHLTANLPFTFPGAGPEFITLMQHLSQADIFLDSATLLPAVLAFNQHPDDDAGLDIPTEIRFSDYRAMNGSQIPFRVQQYVNNTLVLDVQLQTVTLNSGLTASSFAVQ